MLNSLKAVPQNAEPRVSKYEVLKSGANAVEASFSCFATEHDMLKSRQESASFLKKRSKKLLLI
jgi:hypothetical protein